MENSWPQPKEHDAECWKREGCSCDCGADSANVMLDACTKSLEGQKEWERTTLACAIKEFRWKKNPDGGCYSSMQIADGIIAKFLLPPDQTKLVELDEKEVLKITDHYFGVTGNSSLCAKAIVDKFTPPQRAVPCKCVYEGEPHGIEFINAPSGKQWAIGGTNTKDRWQFCPWCGGTCPTSS